MITLSELAATKVKSFLETRGKGLGIRLGVKSSGCSGMAYVLEYADQQNEGDQIFTSHDVNVFVDPVSLPYLTEVKIDWVKKGLNEGFEFNNSNETSRCGCGESFSV